jgi:hypothetical protein
LVLGLSAAFVVVGGFSAGLMLFLLFQICERLLVFGTVIASGSYLFGWGLGVSSFC